MPLRRLVWIVVAVSVVLVLAVGLGRPGEGCEQRTWAAALDGLTDRAPLPCEARALDRVYAVGAGLMGLVLISGLLSRRD